MRLAVFACAIPFATACAGPVARREPPSGAVDPGIHGLAVAGQDGASRRAAERPPHAHDPAVPSLGGVPGAGAPSAAPAEASGRVTMTREHCEALGRKFAELTMAQGGQPTNGAMDREAEGVGRQFADRCARDMVGEQVPIAEYQCMLRAKAADELVGCKR